MTARRDFSLFEKGSGGMEATAQIGVTGLAVMGRNLARNFARNGYTVAVHNRTPARTRALVEQFGSEGAFVPAESPQELVAALERPRRLLIMVKAGDPTDAVIEEFAPLMEEGDIIIDGGNAHFLDTRRREKALRERGIHFVGSGVSGGEEGALHGPSVMPGGSAESYAALGPMLEKISAHVDGDPCCTHIGTDGAGHFVKMVHNGIEYADMQLIAEAYQLLREVAGYTPAEIAEIFRGWNKGRLNSYLIEITAEVLAHTDPDTGVPFVDIVQDAAEQKGTGRWTVQTALDLGSPVTGIAQATFARVASSRAELRAAYRPLHGGTEYESLLRSDEAERFIHQVEQALYASKIIAYDQGWTMIRDGAAEYGWDIDLGEVAKIWRGGCIIRAAFLDRIRAAHAANPGLISLLAEEHFADEIGHAQIPWREVVAIAARRGIPVPAFSAALAFYDTLRGEHLPAALIQGLRDFFGAHTYRRTDRAGTFHTEWAEPGRPEIRTDA
ncbi:MAG TPA: NADP-dependent phosphogluconate dehydrogenase [Actinospica sp.]|nr:NADP-dependent phosphogluconate dehydrogenase [Actinospica sp.]HWG22899.1 NADP-dependent phosphogluconate dehydrogenase [Actinospica sp.]